MRDADWAGTTLQPDDDLAAESIGRRLWEVPVGILNGLVDRFHKLAVIWRRGVSRRAPLRKDGTV
jgi:hypothetical protein